MSQVIVFIVLKSHYHKWRGRQQWGATLRPKSMKATMAKFKIRLLSAGEIQKDKILVILTDQKISGFYNMNVACIFCDDDDDDDDDDDYYYY